MKIELFIALLVLLASTNVFGQNTGKSSGRKGRPSRVGSTTVTTDQQDLPSSDADTVVINGQHDDNAEELTGGTETIRQPGQTVSRVRGNTKNIEIMHDDTKPVTLLQEETVPVSVMSEETRRKPVKIVREETKPVTLIHEESVPVQLWMKK